MDIVTRLRVEASAYERHAVPGSYEESLHDDLVEAANTIEALRDALRGIVEDDDAGTSLDEQRARWDSRMKAARAALSKASPALERPTAKSTGAQS